MKHTPSETIETIRRRMCEERVDAYILPVHDPHFCTPILPRWDAMTLCLGDSAQGVQLIIANSALAVYSDKPQGDECRRVVDAAGVVVLATSEAMYRWIAERCGASGTSHEVALDGMTYTEPEVEQWQRQLRQRGGITLRTNLRLLPDTSMREVEIRLSESCESGARLAALRSALRDRHADGMLMARHHDVRWLLHLAEEGGDGCFPSFVLVSTSAATLFARDYNLSLSDERQLLAAGITVQPYTALPQALKEYFEYNILMDPNEIPFGMYRYVERQIIKEPSPIMEIVK